MKENMKKIDGTLNDLDPGRPVQGSIPQNFSEEVANDLFYGFDIDEDAREFLASLVTSATAPRCEIERIYDLSLTNGADDWHMLIDCATSLRDHRLHGRYGPRLDPYVALILLHGDDREPGSGAEPHLSPLLQVLDGEAEYNSPGKESRTLRKARPKGKSPFWSSSSNKPTSAADAQLGTSKTGRVATPTILPVLAPSEVPTARPSSDGPTIVLRTPITVRRKRRRSTTGEDGAKSLIWTGQSLTISGEDQVEGTTAGHYNPPCSLEQPLSIRQTGKTSPQRQRGKPSKAARSHFFDVEEAKSSGSAEDGGLAGSNTDTNERKPARRRGGVISALPIPPLSADIFGLIQEELAPDPFRLLIAVTFLIKTSGRAAIPVFREVMARYPTPEALAAAEPNDIISMIFRLGLSSKRCTTIQKLARLWLECPPARDVRYGVKNYPRPGDGKDVRLGERFGPEDIEAADDEDISQNSEPEPTTKARGFGTAWEIGHLTQGRYAIDSWRIFCRDVLLGRADDWKGKGRDATFQPEWMRVLPEDKELRACLRWLWMKEGWEWDPVTGEREVLSEHLRKAVDEGRVAYDNEGQLKILNEEEGDLD